MQGFIRLISSLKTTNGQFLQAYMNQTLSRQVGANSTGLNTEK